MVILSGWWSVLTTVGTSISLCCKAIAKLVTALLEIIDLWVVLCVALSPWSGHMTYYVN